VTNQPDESAPPAPPPTSSSRRVFGCAFEIVETLVLTLVIYLVIHNFVAQPFEVEQQSMLPTIAPNEYVLIDKLSPRWSDYTRGDVVVFNPPAGEQGGVPFIKRVIGLPGEEVALRNGRVFVTTVDGRTTELEEPYVALRADGTPVETIPRDAPGTEQWTVGEGEYFVLGDNRVQSQDSRIFGPIPRDLIVGRAWLRYFPLDRLGFIPHPEYPSLATAGSDRLGSALAWAPQAFAGSSATIHGSMARSYGTSPSAPNHRSISKRAVSGASEAWIRLRSPLMPRSPRMVPGSAWFGMVLPTSFRTTAMASGPSTATAATGPEVMNSTSPA
jgi:signal peptidase I